MNHFFMPAQFSSSCYFFTLRSTFFRQHFVLKRP
jgi:hypothetical protein